VELFKTSKMSGTSESTSPTPESSTSTSPSASWAGKLTDGENYRVIRGKKSNSNIIVSDDILYLIEKTVPDKNGEDPITPTYVYYLKCHDPNCLGRANIRKNVLRFKTEGKPHTCQDERSNLDKIAVQEALTRMKKRAQQEGTSCFVS